MDSYTGTCAYITALFRDTDAVELIVAGDVNCHVGSRFYNTFLKVVDNKLQLTDQCRQ